MSFYKWCIVPKCPNTSINNPQKLFITVPFSQNRRKKWCILARRDPDTVAPNKQVYMCEDHFDMEKDIKNFMKFKLGFCKRLQVAPQTVPHKFDCQYNLRDHEGSKSPLPLSDEEKEKICLQSEEIPVKKKKVSNVDKSDSDESLSKWKEEAVTGKDTMSDESSSLSPEPQPDGLESIEHVYIKQEPRNPDNMVMVSENQTDMFPEVKNSSLNEHKTSQINKTKMLLKDTQSKPEDKMTNDSQSRRKSMNKLSKINQLNNEDNSLQKYNTPAKNTQSIKNNVTETTPMYISDRKIITRSEKLHCTMSSLENSPFLFLGIPITYYFIVELIQKTTKIKPEQILFCLKKIRLDNSFTELEDSFGLAFRNTLPPCELFVKIVPSIAKVLERFVNIDAYSLNRKLAFDSHYHAVDCIEFDIEKPLESKYQLLTWSEVKKRHTLKFLFSCLPNGLVHYVSPGHGGHIKNEELIRKCDFLDKLTEGSYVLAERGFNNLELILNEKKLNLLLQTDERHKSDVIVKLQNNLNNALKLLRQFRFLRENCVIESNMVPVLSDVVVIVFAFVNLQLSEKSVPMFTE